MSEAAENIIELEVEQTGKVQHQEALAACASLRIMFERDFALACDLGVTILHGARNSKNCKVIDFKGLSFHHPDIK